MFVRSSVTECESLVARDLDESVICTVLGKSVSASKRRAADESSDGSGEDIFIPSDSHTQEPAAGDLFHVAMKLRRDIEHACKHLPSVPEISQCTPTKSMTWIPDSVFNFLMWTIVGPQACNAGESSLGDRMDAADDRARSKVMAIAQDIVFAVSHGRVVPPKQLALSMATRHLTRSARLVSMLNRFGHGVSDSKLHEIETGIAERTLAEDIPLPSNIKAGNGTVFFCWDNNDLVEETLTGMGTTHCTNGIVIQHPTASNVPDTAQPQLVPAVGSSKKKRPARSLSVVQQEFPQYIIGTRPEPHTVTTTANTPTRSREWLSGEDFLWFLLRSAESTSRFGRPSDEPQTIPVWSKFNADLYCQNKPGQPSNIGYLPVIPAPPTEHSTILEVLRRSVALTRRLDQQHCIITGDQAIYAKALEVLSKHKDEFSEVVLRLGAFHTACAFMVVLGKRFGGAGLGDLLTEAGVVGPNACKQVLAGKHYNRAIRCHKLVFEAMLQQNWELFEEHLEDDYSPHVDEAASDLLGQLDAMRETGNFAEGLQCVQTSAFKSLKERFTTFNDNLKKTSPMACFWLSYMEMVSLLLDFIRASRNGDWVLHLTAFRQMLKWFFAYDHVNYARYGSYYVNDMECLPESHESAQESLVSGDFCVSRSRNSFARVPVDQAIEQPINRDSKGRGGIVGFSKKPGAVHRWILTTHERASLTSACSKLAGPMLHTTQVTKERTAQVKRDEQDLVSLSELLYSWGNPFIGDKLVSLSSRTVCSEKAHDDLLNAGSIGEADVSKFIQERLVQKTASFYDKIPAHSLSTFSTSGQKKKKKSSKLQALKNERQLFTTLVILAKHRSIDIKHLVEFELGPLPWSIATADGCPVSTPKSKLLSDLEKDVAPLETVPQGTAVLIDAMAVLQSYTSVPGTFGDLSKLVFRQLISNFTRFGSKRVDFVSDCYHQLSIKSSERVKRASTNQPLRMLVQRPDQETPKQWKRYLSDPQNKMELIKFFADHWASTTEFATLLGTNRHVYVTVGQRCWLLKVADASNTVVNREDVPQLAAPHEEADCRLLLHAAHCFQHQEEAVAISSPDTDVAVLAIGLCASLQQQVIFKTGTRQRARLVDINAIAQKLGPAVSDALIGLHAYTGCDSVSAFSGKGKSSGLAIIKTDEVLASVMSRLGQSFTVDASLLAACETFTCRLYGFPDSTEINAVRYKLLCANATTPERLPPSQNALKQHVHRANYQAAVWRGALRNDLVQPTPVGNGWVQSSDGMLQIQWMTQEATPKDIRDLITCGCKTGCMSNRRCKCRKNGLPCADVCKCTLTACTNRPVPVQQTQATSISATALTAVTVEEESDESDSDGRDGSTDSNDTADTISAEDFSSNELEH